MRFKLAILKIHDRLLGMSLLKNTLFALLLGPGAAFAQSQSIDEMLTELAKPDLENWQLIQERVLDAWSKSGSDTADLLLERGREAMEAKNYLAALEHLTALTDHAPDFAEGWNARATVYFHLDRYGQSIADVAKVLSLNPKHFGALSGLGIMLRELGQEKDALAAFRAAQEINPHWDSVNQAVEDLSKSIDGKTL
jgi:tetratricopeptide (TPR) repeat protein